MSEIGGPEPAAWRARTVESRLDYWRELWEDLVNFRYHFRGLSLRSPRLLLREIVDELDDGFRNKHTIKHLQHELNELTKADPALRADGSAFRLLRQEFAKKRPGYLRALCGSAMEQFTDGKYARFQCDELKRILLNPTSTDAYSSLLFSSEMLIVELVVIGYSWQFIAERPSHVLASYSIWDSGHLHTQYPHDMSTEPFNGADGTFDSAAYNAALENALKKLTPADRLERFAKYFVPRRRRSWFVFEVEGLRPDFEDPDHDLTIGNVTLYWPHAQRFLGPPEQPILRGDETFGHEREATFINAAVAIDGLEDDRESALMIAAQDAERAVDIVNAYVNKEKPYRINRDSYVVGDENQKAAGAAISYRDGRIRFAESANLKDAKIYLKDRRLSAASTLMQSVVDMRNDTEKRLFWGFRWLRKANEATNTEDALLFSWVVLETLLGAADAPLAASSDDERQSRFGRALEFVPSAALRGFRWWVLQSVRDRLTRAVFSTPRDAVFPAELQQAACLVPVPYTTYDLTNVLPQLPQLRAHLIDRRLDDWLVHAEKFYSEPRFAAAVFERRFEAIRHQVVMIYRLRNRIVHSAHYEHPFLSYYADQAEDLAETTLLAIFDAYALNRDATVHDVMLRLLAKMQVLVDRLKGGEKIDLLAD